MKRIFIALFLAAALAFAVTVRADEECSEPVLTSSGLVRGFAGEDTQTCAWKGIPYAAPPVGDLRFRAPRPAPSWEGVRDALDYGPRCMQVLADDETMSEDCLYLNVWRPRKSGGFPVMVWIHGGGYIMGSGGGGSVGLGYDGSRISEFGDMVVVTINYRLHALGFLADPALQEEDENGSTGGYGSLDQAFAIRWVHDNIEAFGGDPKNVTIFGESAGGWSVCTMLATPLNRGMIHRAILESGGCEKSASLEDGYAQGREIARRVGCEPSDLECLRQVPAEKFLGGFPLLYKEGMAYEPHHDGYLLTDTPLAMIREGNYNRVPFLAGSNRNEFDAALIVFPQRWHTLPFQYQWRARRMYGLDPEDAEALVGLYPLSEFGPWPRQAYGRMITDYSLACPVYVGIGAAAAHQKDVYLYRFDYDDSRIGRYVGAFHALEVPLVFNTIGGNDSAGEGAPELSRIIQGYWTNFARSGDPNGAGLPVWPRFDQEGQMRLILDTDVRAERADLDERCGFWEEYSRTHAGLEEMLGKRPGR